MNNRYLVDVTSDSSQKDQNLLVAIFSDMGVSVSHVLEEFLPALQLAVPRIFGFDPVPRGLLRHLVW
jgi:hypothetical protein